MLIQQAWDNESILRQFQSFELSLMRCESLSELIQTLLNECRAIFNLDYVTLNLCDANSEIQQLLNPGKKEEKEIIQSFSGLAFSLGEEKVMSFFDENQLPKLGQYDPTIHAELFQSCPISIPIKSIALLLLKRDSHIIGCMSLGDIRLSRFKKDSATDFLQHLAAVISICIDMTILRDKIKQH